MVSGAELMRPFVDGVDGDQLEAELLDLLDEAVQVRLVAHRARQHGAARGPLEAHALEQQPEAIADLAAEHELVALAVIARRRLAPGLGGLSSPSAFT